MVFQRCLIFLLAQKNTKLPPMLHNKNVSQYKVIVKVHRVFPSSYSYSASSRKLQFHWINIGDSREVVTPFMHVGTYPTRNFATLGPLWLQPPFTGTYIRSFKTSPYHLPAPGRCQILYIILRLCRILCF